MSYELVLFEHGYAADCDTARAAWNDERYWDTSLPDYDRSAAKWRWKDLLMGFESQVEFVEPQPPKTGFFAKWFSKPAPIMRCLHVYVDYGYGEMAFDVYDQAIEITLPWEAPRADAEGHVRLLWFYLEGLSDAGWSTIYDTERDALLNLETDFDAVLARYRKNLAENEADESHDGPAPQAASNTPPLANAPQSVAAAAKPASPAAAKSDKPFTGNVN